MSIKEFIEVLRGSFPKGIGKNYMKYEHFIPYSNILVNYRRRNEDGTYETDWGICRNWHHDWHDERRLLCFFLNGELVNERTPDIDIISFGFCGIRELVGRRELVAADGGVCYDSSVWSIKMYRPVPSGGE